MAYRYLTPVKSQPFLEKKNPDEVKFKFQKDSLKPFLLRLPNSEYMIFPGIRIFPKQNIVMMSDTSLNDSELYAGFDEDGNRIIDGS